MKKLFVFVTVLIATVTVVKAVPPEKDGKTIFTLRCATCHNVNKTLVGPALAGVDERRSIEWIIKFVQSSQSLIKQGDEQANAIFAKFNGIQMPNHPDLTADNIRDIVSFIKSEAKPTETNAAPFARPSTLHPAYIPIASDNYIFFAALFGSIVLLVLSLLMFVRVKEWQRNGV
jgi:cytochrome c2